MTVHRFRQDKDLPSGTLEFLAQDELRNNVPYGVLQRLRKSPQFFQDYRLFVVTEADKIRLYAHHTPPFLPYLSAGDPAAAAELAAALKDEGPLPGLLGPLPVVEAFLDAWPELRSSLPHIERQGLYRLDQVVMPPSTGAAFGQGRIEDLDLYFTWLRDFCHELGDMYAGDEKALDQQRERIEAGDLYCLTYQGRPVCMAIAARKLPTGQSVSFVYTPPQDRGRGYAAELVARLSQKLLQDGNQYCCLFTQMHNPVSNRIYQRIGYYLVDEFRKYHS